MGDQPRTKPTTKEQHMPGKSRVQFDTPIGRITTIPLDQANAARIATEARSAGATEITVTEAK